MNDTTPNKTAADMRLLKALLLRFAGELHPSIREYGTSRLVPSRKSDDKQRELCLTIRYEAEEEARQTGINNTTTENN